MSYFRDEQFTVRAFQVAQIKTHGAICSDDWGRNNPMELHSDFGRYAVIPAEWFRALDPQVGSWVIEYPDGRMSFRTEAAFAQDYDLIEDQLYRTVWQPLFSGKAMVRGIDPAEVGKDETRPPIVITNTDDLAYANYLQALSEVMLTPMDLDVKVSLRK